VKGGKVRHVQPWLGAKEWTKGYSCIFHVQIKRKEEKGGKQEAGHENTEEMGKEYEDGLCDVWLMIE
jgi:hypothetical protein